jgi:methyltransferase OMS1
MLAARRTVIRAPGRSLWISAAKLAQPRPKAQPKSGQASLGKIPPGLGGWAYRIRGKWRQIENDPIKRKRTALVMLAFYLVTFGFGVRYLYETRYKALGEENPNKKSVQEDSGHEVHLGSDTTPIYDKIAEEYDSMIQMEELTSYIWYLRRKAMKRVSGDVLELSCGTGRNVKYIDTSNVRSVTFLDTSRPMLDITQRKFAQRFPEFDRVQFVQGRAEDVAAMAAKSGQKFDTIYESFGLCSHEDPVAALRSCRQLLRPDGRIVLLEHGRSYYDSLNKRMDERAEQRFQDWGCRWNLDIPSIIKASGLEIEEQDRYHFGTSYFYVLKVPTAPAE